MLERGPIPAVVHGAVEYVAGVFLIAAPVLIDFHSNSAVALSLVFGVAMLALAAVSEMPTGLIPQVPVSAHLVLDFAAAALLIAAPFIFGFADVPEAAAVFIVLGIAHLLIAIGTRFVPAPNGTSLPTDTTEPPPPV